MTRFVDLSIPITNEVISDPEVMRPRVTYMTHESTWEQIAMFFPGLQRERPARRRRVGGRIRRTFDP